EPRVRARRHHGTVEAYERNLTLVSPRLGSARRRTRGRPPEQEPERSRATRRICADRDQRRARGAAPGGARLGGAPLPTRRAPIVPRRRNRFPARLLGRAGGAGLARAARRRGPRRRGLWAARIGGGARGGGGGGARRGGSSRRCSPPP